MFAADSFNQPLNNWECSRITRMKTICFAIEDSTNPLVIGMPPRSIAFLDVWQLPIQPAHWQLECLWWQWLCINVHENTIQPWPVYVGCHQRQGWGDVSWHTLSIWLSKGLHMWEWLPRSRWLSIRKRFNIVIARRKTLEQSFRSITFHVACLRIHYASYMFTFCIMIARLCLSIVIESI